MYITTVVTLQYYITKKPRTISLNILWRLFYILSASYVQNIITFLSEIKRAPVPMAPIKA